jgi:hypothetical protein
MTQNEVSKKQVEASKKYLEISLKHMEVSQTYLGIISKKASERNISKSLAFIGTAFE